MAQRHKAMETQMLTETIPRYMERVPSLATPMSRVLEMGRYIAVRIIRSACSHTNTRAITAVIWALCHLLMSILPPLSVFVLQLGTGSSTFLRITMKDMSTL